MQVRWHTSSFHPQPDNLAPATGDVVAITSRQRAPRGAALAPSPATALTGMPEWWGQSAPVSGREKVWLWHIVCAVTGQGSRAGPRVTWGAVLTVHREEDIQVDNGTYQPNSQDSSFFPSAPPLEPHGDPGSVVLVWGGPRKHPCQACTLLLTASISQ